MRVIRLPEVMHKSGLSKSVIYELVKDGSFPSPVMLGERRRGWIEEEVEAWIQDRPRVRLSDE